MGEKGKVREMKMNWMGGATRRQGKSDHVRTQGRVERTRKQKKDRAGQARHGFKSVQQLHRTPTRRACVSVETVLVLGQLPLPLLHSTPSLDLCPKKVSSDPRRRLHFLFPDLGPETACPRPIHHPPP